MKHQRLRTIAAGLILLAGFTCRGYAFPWEEKLKEFSEIKGDKELVKKIWEDVDSLAYVYIWHCLLSF